MKFETTVQHYGKHCIRLRMCALICCLYQHKQDDNGNIIMDDEVNEFMFAKKRIVYIGQILKDGNRQDDFALILFVKVQQRLSVNNFDSYIT